MGHYEGGMERWKKKSKVANDELEPFLDWILQIQNTEAPPLVHSVSYDDQENTIHVDVSFFFRTFF